MENPWTIETEEEYHEKTWFMSSSQLKLLAKSPLHYKKLYLDGYDPPMSKSLINGKMIHTFLLEPNVFKEKYAFLPDKDDSRFRDALFTVEDLKTQCMKLGLQKSGSKKELTERIHAINDRIIVWDKYIADLCEGRIPVTLKQQEMLLEIFNNIANYKQAMNLITDGIPEVSGYWEDTSLELDCKFRTDWINERGYIIEVKSINSMNYFKFLRQVREYRYDIGAAWYIRGYTAIKKQPPQGFIFFVIETQPPYSVALWTPNDSVLSTGEFGDENKEATPGFVQCVEKYKQSIETGIWSGPQSAVETLSFV